MPPKRTTRKQRTSDEEEMSSIQIDVQYNPDIVASLLADLHSQVESKCNQIQKDSDFMVTSIRQAFNLELIKLPTQVKTMSLKKFKLEFGESLEAVTKGVMASHGKTTASKQVFQTPSHRGKMVAQTPGGSLRNPKEGETILSINGSPLGEFQTVKKAPKAAGSSIVPPTPGVFVPLSNGEIIDMDDVDIENMTQENKEDAMAKMQAVMANMQSLMNKLQQPV